MQRSLEYMQQTLLPIFQEAAKAEQIIWEEHHSTGQKDISK